MRPWRAGLAISLVACAIVLSSTQATLAQDSAPAQQSSGLRSSSRPSTAQRGAPQSNTAAAVVDQPRGTGYFVGDKVLQRVLLESGGQPVSPLALPPPGRVSAWFERRSASIQSDISRRRWLVVEYQVLNAPPKLLTVKLPAWSVKIERSGQSAAGTPRASSAAPAALTVPAASINIAPLSLPGSPTQVGTADLRPDRLPPIIATAPIWRSIERSAGALCLTLIAWLGWVIWRNRRALATQPFARALREMRTLDDREPRSWQALHRAFDQTAGRVIQHATLPTLFERAPQLTPARAQIEEFFAQSSLLFFTPASSNRSRRPAEVSPRALCVELRQIERRHER